MFSFAILVSILTFTSCRASNVSFCDDFQANFDVKTVIGSWYVVAIIPGNLFPDKDIACYMVEFSETDGAGLKWLVNRTLDSDEANVTKSIHGIIIRQRYHSEHPFDVWSQTVDGVSGCFEQVISLDADTSDLNKALSQEANMQLHVIGNDKDPFLLQILWGKMVSAVVYRKGKEVTLEELKPVYELLSKLRGHQRLPRICKKHHREPILLH
ncbi:hypothetical protein ACJJTC_017278 [Scirpophaga incertulas]